MFAWSRDRIVCITIVLVEIQALSFTLRVPFPLIMLREFNSYLQCGFNIKFFYKRKIWITHKTEVCLLFERKFGGHTSGNSYKLNPFCLATDTRFGLLVMCVCVSKPGWIPSLACFVACMQPIPKIHLWCNTCWPLGGQHGSRDISSTYLRVCLLYI